MRNWRIKSIISAASMACFLAVPIVWAEQETPLEVKETAEKLTKEPTDEDQAPAGQDAGISELEILKRMIQDVISENQDLKNRVRELEEAMKKQQQAAEEEAKDVAKEPTDEDEEAVKEKAEHYKLQAAEEDAKKAEWPAEVDNEQAVEEEAKDVAKEPTDEDEEAVKEKAAHYKLQAAEEAAKKATAPVEEDDEDLASKISEHVTFGGAIEVEAFWEKDFDNKEESKIRLETAEIDFEVRAHEWATGWLSIEYDTDDDKVKVDETFVNIGNTAKFPLYLVAGRLVVPFGLASGETVSDTPLSITDPLTTEVFETKEDVGLLGFTRGGFEAGVYAFSGSLDHIKQFGATAGYTIQNDDWSFDAGIDLISNVFETDELSDAFADPKSDYTYGVATHFQLLISDFSIVAEYNGALDNAGFEDEDDGQINVRPEAWQIELGYFTEILDKDTFFVLGYSQSDNLGGEFAERRLLGTIGMWIFDDLRLKLEYGHDWDYSTSEDGTGAESDKVTSQLTYEW